MRSLRLKGRKDFLKNGRSVHFRPAKMSVLTSCPRVSSKTVALGLWSFIFLVVWSLYESGTWISPTERTSLASLHCQVPGFLSESLNGCFLKNTYFFFFFFLSRFRLGEGMAHVMGNILETVVHRQNTHHRGGRGGLGSRDHTL